MNHIPRIAPLRRLVREVPMASEEKPAAVSPDPSAQVVDSAATASGAPVADDNRRIWQSTELLGDKVEALIAHRGQTYRLRCTKQGKLILYK